MKIMWKQKKNLVNILRNRTLSDLKKKTPWNDTIKLSTLIIISQISMRSKGNYI